ncbi:hypothetical protein A4A49_43445 [Nicotiana attenuata]|nr:hypothetical protein A4A49_43445 [Nicotiana attenuata]
MAAGAGRALLGAPTTQIRKQLAAGRVLLGAPRTQMRYVAGDRRYIVIEVSRLLDSELGVTASNFLPARETIFILRVNFSTSCLSFASNFKSH